MIGARFEPEGLTFITPAVYRITMPSSVGSENLIGLRFDGTGARWNAVVPCVVDVTGQVVPTDFHDVALACIHDMLTTLIQEARAQALLFADDPRIARLLQLAATAESFSFIDLSDAARAAASEALGQGLDGVCCSVL